MSENMKSKPTGHAVGLPVEREVRPRAWAWKDDPSGEEVFSGWNNPRPELNSEPLYDQAAIDAAVAAERERCARLAVDAAAAAVKKYEDDQAPVRQPYANNRLMHVGWDAAERIRSA